MMPPLYELSDRGTIHLTVSTLYIGPIGDQCPPTLSLPFLSTYLPEGNRDAPNLGNQMNPFSQRDITHSIQPPFLIAYTSQAFLAALYSPCYHQSCCTYRHKQQQRFWNVKEILLWPSADIKEPKPM